MNKIPTVLGKLRSQLLYILGIPVFFLSFMLVYKPAAATLLLDMGNNMLSFNCTIIMCILLGVMIISRALMMVLYHHQLRLDWLRYFYWQIAELLTMSLFTAPNTHLPLSIHHLQRVYGFCRAKRRERSIRRLAHALCGQHTTCQTDDCLIRSIIYQGRGELCPYPLFGRRPTQRIRATRIYEVLRGTHAQAWPNPLPTQLLYQSPTYQSSAPRQGGLDYSRTQHPTGTGHPCLPSLLRRTGQMAITTTRAGFPTRVAV